MEKKTTNKKKITTKKKVTIAVVCALVVGGISAGAYFLIKNSKMRSLTFKGENCTLKDENGNAISNKSFEVGTSVSFKIEKEGDTYELPNQENVKFTYTSTGEPFEGTYSYNEITGDVSLTLSDNVTITATSVKKWYLDLDYLNNLKKEDVTKEGGEVKTIIVNGKKHKVRLVGVDEDTDLNGETIHTTWEFMNLISNARGYSFAVQWNDSNDSDTWDYATSSIHNALVGNDPVLWAERGESGWSKRYTGSVLSMLPSDLVNVLKVADKDDYEVTDGDKLFLLSESEVSGNAPYSYYLGKENKARIKKQVNENKLFPEYTIIPKGSGQIYDEYDVISYPGYNYRADDTGGGIVWLRSKSKSDFNKYIHHNGSLQDNTDPNHIAKNIAPAFCL